MKDDIFGQDECQDDVAIVPNIASWGGTAIAPFQLLQQTWEFMHFADWCTIAPSDGALRDVEE